MMPGDPAGNLVQTGGRTDRRPVEPLFERYGAVALDLDGVLHRGAGIIPAAPAVLARLRERRTPVVFLTNNSSRTPEEVAHRLVTLGLDARPSEILTSALATAAMLSAEGHEGSTAYVVGGNGVRTALRSVGVRVEDGRPQSTDLVVIGWDDHADYAKLTTASLLVERGARLIATNGDRSFPSEDGLWPGAGALLAVVTTTTGAPATVVGKPATPMFEEAARMAGQDRPLMVGDRLETDIAGAVAAGWDSLLVLTGASRPGDLTDAEALPTYVAPTVGGLLEPLPRVVFRCADPGDLAEVDDLISAAGLPTMIAVAPGPLSMGTPAAGAQAAGPRTTSALGATDPSATSRTVIGRLAPLGSSASAGQHPTKREPVATATLVSTDEWAYLCSVAVRPDLRGLGIGLLAAAAVLRLRDGRLPVFVMTERAASFFDRLGFVPLPTEGLPSSVAALTQTQGCGSSAAAMVLYGADGAPYHPGQGSSMSRRRRHSPGGGPPPRAGSAPGAVHGPED
jgi:glycerol 3-phosphatase-2